LAAPLRLVIFDCDGTLIDSQHMIVAAMNHAFEAHGEPLLPREEVLSIVGLSLHEAIGALVPAADAARRLALVQSYKDAFFHLRGDPDLAEPLFEGIAEAVERLASHENVLLGIATGKSDNGLEAALERHNLTHHFVTLQTADRHPSKPHPSMVLEAMRQAGAEPQDTVVIGDTGYDMEMARAARAHAIGVAWGYHPVEELERAGAGTVLTHIDELGPALEALWPAKEGIDG